MHKVVRRSGRRCSLIRSGAALVLGAPLALNLGTFASGGPRAGAADHAPAVQPTAGRTDGAPIGTQSPPTQPQFNAERYQSEVQRQLQLLYQQNAQTAGSAAPPNAAPPPAGSAGPRKLRMKDWWKPSAWKRQYHRWQRQREQDRRQQAAKNVPESHLGAPNDVTLGGTAPLTVPPTAAAPTLTLPPSQPPATAAAPQPGGAVQSQIPSSGHRPATPAGVAARPQLQRVSPEIFAGPDDDESALRALPAPNDAGPTLELGAAQSDTSEQPPRLLPAPNLAQPSPLEIASQPNIAETPQLILLPNPDYGPENEITALPEAPSAELSPPDVADSDPAASISDNGGFIDEPADIPFDGSASADDEPLLGSETEPATSVTTVAEQTAATPTGPFSGLELESNPFAERTPAVERQATPLNAPSPPETPADAPAPLSVPAESTLMAPGLPERKTAALNSSTPAALSAPLALTAAPQPESAASAALSEPAAGRPLAAAAPSAPATRPDVERKLSRIAERKGLTGFKGFCPVMLRDYRELVDARLEHTVVYEGRQYWFSSAAARETFLLDPTAYVPARGGIDVVIFDRTGESRDGSLDHAVWYRGQLYLFDSEDTRAAFARSPQAHAVAQ